MTIPNNRVTLTNPQVNSGATINMQVSDITTAIDVFTATQNTPSATPASAYTARVSYGRNTGLANPIHTLQGVFKVNQSSHSTGASATLDWEHMIDLLNRSDQTMVLTSDKFKTTTNTTGEINVMIKSYSDSFPVSDSINYTLILVEVRT
jgi:hypothetical protein